MAMYGDNPMNWQQAQRRHQLLVNVESAARNTTIFPDSRSFELHFPSLLDGVQSIEVVDLCVPNAEDASSPVDKYFFVANGLLNSQTGTFSSQGIVGAYEDMEAERTRLTIPMFDTLTPHETATAGGIAYTQQQITNQSALPAYAYKPVGIHSFGKFFHNDDASTVQIWEHPTQSKSVKVASRRLGKLQFALVERDGQAYDHATTAFPDDPAYLKNWTMTLRITLDKDENN